MPEAHAVQQANQAFREGRWAEALEAYRRLAATQPAQRELWRAALHRCLVRLQGEERQSLRVSLPDPSVSIQPMRYAGRECLALQCEVPPHRQGIRALRLSGLALRGPAQLQMRVAGSSDWIALAELAPGSDCHELGLPGPGEVEALRLVDAGLEPGQAPSLQTLHFLWQADAPVPERHSPSGVAAGVASQPERSTVLAQVVAGLAPQVDELHVFLNGYPEVPDWLQRLPHARVYRSQDWGDLGDAGKFHGFARSTLPYYLSFDDDILYPPDYVATLRAACERYGAPVGVHGRLLRQPNQGYYGRADCAVLHYRRALAYDRRVHVLGTGTLMLPRAAVPRLPDFDYRNMADIWFARHCWQAGLALHAVARRSAWLRDAPGVHGSIFDAHRGSHSDQRLIVDALVREQAAGHLGLRGPRPKFMLGLRSFRRMASLAACLQAVQATACDTRFELVVVIADDGSSAGALQWVYELQFPYELHVIRSARSGAAAQTNRLLERGRALRADFMLLADDTLRLLKPGWMSLYFDAARASGLAHLCHVGGAAGRTSAHARLPLQAQGPLRRRPALMSVTPALLDAVGDVDESLGSDAPLALLDFSARCCAAGFNDRERLYDALGAHEYLEALAVPAQGIDPGGAALAEAGPQRATEPVAAPTAWAGFDRVMLVQAPREGPRGGAGLALRAAGLPYWLHRDLDLGAPGLAAEHAAYLARWQAAADTPLQPDDDAARCARLEQALGGPALATINDWLALRNWQRRLRAAWKLGAQRLLLVHEDAAGDSADWGEWLQQLVPALAELPADWRLLQWGGRPPAEARRYATQWASDEHEADAGQPVGPVGHVGPLAPIGALALQREAIPPLLDSLGRELLPFERGALPRALRRFADQCFVGRAPGQPAWPTRPPASACADAEAADAAAAASPATTLLQAARGPRPRLVVGVKTYNRRPYVLDCLQSLRDTACSERFEIVLLVADDGSSDGTLEALERLQFPFAYEILRHQRRYVAGQFNALLQRALALQADFFFSVDDDVHFRRKGWMSAYYDAALASGFHHLCHYNRPHAAELAARRGEALGEPQHHRDHPLEAHAGVDRAMGALFTLTPAVAQAVGFADEANFFVRGGWHADYSARCCRAGFNEVSRFWDLADSNAFIALQNNKDGAFHSAIDWEEEGFRRASTAAERERRTLLRRNPDRLHIDLAAARSGPLWTPEQAASHRRRRVEDLFERVFVINLERRSDRLAAVDAQLRRHGIGYQRFAAADGRDADIQQAYARYRAGRPPPDPADLLSATDFYGDAVDDAARTRHVEARIGGPAIRSAGAWAYLLTYQRLLEQCRRDGLERVLVLDDDALLHRDFDTLFDACSTELPRHWKLFQLGTMQYDWALTQPYSEHLYRPGAVLVASHAVGLQRDCFEPLLEGIARWSLPFDIGPLQDCSRRFTEASFVAQPNLVIQDQRESDIVSSDHAEAEVAKQANIYRWNLADYPLP